MSEEDYQRPYQVRYGENVCFIEGPDHYQDEFPLAEDYFANRQANGLNRAFNAGRYSEHQRMRVKIQQDGYRTFIHQLERRIFDWALEAEKGSITRAARLLKITHQGFAFMLTRHKGVNRLPIRRRGKTLIDHSKVGKSIRFRKVS